MLIEAEHKLRHEFPIPPWAALPIGDCIRKLDEETRFLHLSMRGLNHLKGLPELLQVVEDLRVLFRKDEDALPIEPARRDAEWVQREIKSDFPLLHEHSVVGVWSALEVMCEDLVVTWLDNRPDAWDLEDVSALKIPVGIFNALGTTERSRFIVHELERAKNGKLKTGVGRFEALLDVFDLAPRVGPELRRAIHELSQVRNVIVHCGGRSDKKLAIECPWLPWKIGERVAITHRLYGWYHGAARRYADRLLNQLVIQQTGSGCNCPGMDDWRSRPPDTENAESQPT